MRVYVVSKEKEILGSSPECAEDLTTNLKVFQHIKDAITFVKSFNYLADDLSLDSMVSLNGEEADFWTAEDGLLVLSVTSDWKNKGDDIVRYTLYIEEMELE